MRSKLLIISIFVILFLFSSFGISTSEASLALLSVDKQIYEIEETVEILINLDIVESGAYELHISYAQGSFTYKGEFNNIMFFYPTEEGIYTIALVEKSTRAIYYSVSFTVNSKEGYIPPTKIDLIAGTKELSEEIVREQVSSEPEESTLTGFVYTDKKEYVAGEYVRIFVDVSDAEKVGLFHSFEGVSKRYMGDLSYINFIPTGIGTHTLFLKDEQGNSISAYVFEIKEDASKKSLRLINSRGVIESGEVRIINEKNGLNSLEIIPDKKILKKIKLRDYKETSDFSLGIDAVKPEKVRISQRKVLKSYALDPSNLNFTNGTATGTAVGSELWKCKDWDFANQQCLGTWAKVMDLIPGQDYEFEISPEDPGYAETGVASINTKKPIYHPDETAEIVIVVLDTAGYLVSNANVVVNVTNPNNQTTSLSTGSSNIIETTKGIYKVNYSSTSFEGNYSLAVSATGPDVDSVMYSYFTVKSFYEFDILRDTPVTVDPWLGPFNSSIQLVSYVSASSFSFTEVLPDNFTVSNYDGASKTEHDNKIYLTWSELSNTSVVSYSARPPLVSPDLYAMGPSYIDYDIGFGTTRFYEARPWYLAIDPTAYYDPNSNIVQAWDEGTGTDFDQINDGIRQPAVSNITDDYVADYTQGPDGASQFGFPSISQTNPLYMTLWVYTGTGASCSYTYYLYQGGSPVCTKAVSVGQTNHWNNCNWTSPTGDYSDMRVVLGTVSKGAGGHSTCYVYAAYLEVAYNTPPNITNLTNPGDGDLLNYRTNIDFNFTVYDDISPVTSCTLYGNFSGTWAANETISNVPVDTETNITINVSDGSYIWNVNCTDQYGAYDLFDTNYSIRVDTTYPTIDYSTGMEPNNTFINQNWVYVNVSADDTNEANITFRLYNTSGPVNITTYYTSVREANFTGLDPNIEYWYNVTVCDEFGWCNTTETQKITLDSLFPTINYSSGTEDNDTYFNRTWVYVNVSADETNEANITFRLYNTTGEVNITTYYTPIRIANFTGLDPNMEYWYNVTIIDWAGQSNTTVNYKITLDNIIPTINFSTGMEPNNTFINQDWVYVNVTANDTNEANITFRLYNTSGPVNITPYYTNIREINFTNLDPNIQYWFNATIVDWVNQVNSTVTFTITLDNTYPTIDLAFPPNDTFINYNSTQFNYTPIDTYLDACVLYANFTGPFASNETHNNPVNGTNNSFGPITLADGRYIWNVMCNDSAGNTNFSAYNYTIKIDTQNPVIIDWKINGTAFVIYDYVCLNVSVTDSFSGVDTVYAEIEDPNTDVENITLLDNGLGCDISGGDNIYSTSIYNEFGGNYTWLNTYANDSAGSWQKNVTNLEWNVTAAGSMTVNMTYPSADIEINESEYNYNFTMTCNVSCDAGGIDCENVTVSAQYNPSTFTDITTSTTNLVNAEDNFSCGTLTAGGAYCLHTFNITSGSDSGDNIWPIRCSATSDSVGSYVSGSWSVTVNDHPFANFTYPLENEWLTGTEMLNASHSIDSDGTIANYLFEYDNNTGFSSPATICDSADHNCTFNTSSQNQCDNNSLTCYVRVTVTDNDGLINSTYRTIGFDTNAPTITLGFPRDFENITTDLFNVNATPQDDESGVDTVTFEYRKNNTDTWTFACNDNRDPTYDCDWVVTSLPDGHTYEFRAYANDSKGNTGTADVHTNITIDRAGPVIYLELPVNQSNQTVNNITFYYNATDADSNITNCSLVIDGSIVNTSYDPAENTSLFMNYSLSEGSYNWNINCTDVLGNQNASEIREINVDTGGPVSTLDNPANDSIITGILYEVNASIVDSGLAEIDTATFEYRRNSTDTWTLICRDNRDPTYKCEWDTTAVPDGDEYEVRVYTNDTWGNIGNTDTHINITVDNNKPNVTLVSPAPFAIDTDGDLVFVYQVADISPIKNCNLTINNEWNQSNYIITRDINQYFYLYGVDDGVELNWSVNCTDYINLTDKSEFRNISVTLNADMNVNLSLNKSIFYAGQTAVITHNVTDVASQPASDVDMVTAIVFANTTVPWWNDAWERRKLINLSSGSDLTNVMVEVNISGLDNNISSCANEIRIIRFDTNNILSNVNRTFVIGDNANYCVVRFRANISAGVDNTEYMAYYNNSGASNPNNDETRRNTNTTLTAIGSSILGSDYNVNSGAFSSTTSDDNTNYFGVGRNNEPPTGYPLNAYLNLSYNISDLGNNISSETDLVSLNFTINYCHSNDAAIPITCGAAIGSGTPGTAYAELFNYDSNSWDAGFGIITQNINSAAENTETYSEADNLNDYNQNTSNIVNVRFQTNIGGLGKSTDASFALDYAYLTVFHKEEVFAGLEDIGSPHLAVAANSSVTDYQGLWIWNWDTTGQAEGNYTATTYGNKTGYNDNYDYEWFEILIDTTGPVSTLDRPLADSTVDGVALGFTYTVNATVTDADVGIIDTVTFMYRYNDTDTWKLICRDQDGTAPFECNWDLSGLSNGWDYEVLVYANDSLGNLGDNNTHINITVITEYINITSILVDDSVDIPLDQIDLIAGTTKTVYCNLTIWDPEVYTNISSVNATFYSSTTTFDASDANQTHYTNTSCTLISGGGNTADYVCGFTVWHFALNGTWECRGYTENLYSSNISLDNTTVSQLFAINISTTLINYTDLEPDQESPNVEVNVSNVGNMPMNISVYGFGGEDELGGTDLSMICEINNISVEFERFSTSSGVAYDSKNQLSSTPQDIGLTIPAKANEAEVKSNSTYWQFMVPPHEQAFGQCNGSVVFMAESP